MTPQERQLIEELFDRLASLERAQRDRDAERAIAEGFERAPNAAYALVQTVLVQDEALKQADARIRELTGEPESQPENRGFLDSMRDSLFGRREEPRPGSVPRVRPGDQPMGVPPGYDRGGPSGGPWAGNPGMPPQYQQPQPYQEQPRGGSFLGTAAAAAAGVIGGGLLLGGIRNMLGGQTQGPFAGTFDQLNPQSKPQPFGDPGDLGRQAGLEDIGRNPNYGVVDNPRGDYERPQPAGLIDQPVDQDPGYDGPFESDGGDMGGSDT